MYFAFYHVRLSFFFSFSLYRSLGEEASSRISFRDY
jgi:hypothetical protein